MPHFEKTENPNYLIDKKTNLVINTNESELLSYRAQIKQELELRNLRNNFNNVSKELEELKFMINSILKDGKIVVKDNNSGS